MIWRVGLGLILFTKLGSALSNTHINSDPHFIKAASNDLSIHPVLKTNAQFRLLSLPAFSVLPSTSLFLRQWITPDQKSNLNTSKWSTQVIHLHYKAAAPIADMLQKSHLNFLSTAGTVDADDKENVLWVHDHVNQVNKIRNLITKMDQPTLQVYIKAKIINIDSQYMRTLGTAFGSVSNQSVGNSQGGIENLTIPIAQLGHDVLLEATLDALEKEGHARLISNPQLITLDREPATIEAGEEVPYQQSTDNGGTSVAFKKAVLSLQVTPEILPQQRILLHLKINQDQVGSLTFNGVPSINTQQIVTQVYVKDKSTVVLGGIFEQTDSLQHGLIPGLGKVPVVGNLFHHQDRINNRSQLLIFVTPIIVAI